MRDRALPRLVLPLILLGYLSLATLYAIRVPIWNAPDEPAHYNVIRTIAVERRLPVLQPGDYDQARIGQLTRQHFPSDQSIEGIRYESHQPPLYYLIAAPVAFALRDADPRTQGLALRFVTIAIGAAVILASYRLAQLIFPKSAIFPPAVAAFVAFVPQHLFMSAAIDNDALAELMLCLTLIVLVEDLQEGEQPRNDLRAGALVGLAILTKLVAAVSAVLVVLGFLGSAWLARDRPAALRRLPLRLLRSGAIALLLSGWWIVRNLIIYGVDDPFGLGRHAEVVVGQPLTGPLSPRMIGQMLQTFFHSFWGQFGWMGIPFADRTYDLLTAFTLIIGLGVGLFVWRALAASPPLSAAEPRVLSSLPQWEGTGSDAIRVAGARPPGVFAWALGLLLAETLLVMGGVVFYNLRYLQPQGRYLFPALPALAIFAAVGLSELIQERYRGLVLALVGLALYWLCIYALFQVIGPAFADH